jgi:hypothetical protein
LDKPVIRARRVNGAVRDIQGTPAKQGRPETEAAGEIPETWAIPATLAKKDGPAMRAKQDGLATRVPEVRQHHARTDSIATQTTIREK